MAETAESKKMKLELQAKKERLGQMRVARDVRAECRANSNASTLSAMQEDGESDSFSTPENRMRDPNLRLGFIRKVYTILLLQLLITFGIVCLFSFNSSVKLYIVVNPALVYAAVVVSFITLFMMMCFIRRHPHNIIMLGVFTIAEGILTGYIAAFYDTHIVSLAMGITLLLTGALRLFACQTKYDFTGSGVYLFTALCCLLLFGILNIFIRTGNQELQVQLVAAALAGLIFSFHIVYHTQMIVGVSRFPFWIRTSDKHKLCVKLRSGCQFSMDDYIPAAIFIYLNIIEVFVKIFRILGKKKKKR